MNAEVLSPPSISDKMTAHALSTSRRIGYLHSASAEWTHRRSLSTAFKLKLVLGINCRSGNSIAMHAETGICAYIASNAIVIFDTSMNRQVGFLKGSKNWLETIGFSTDGKYLVSGESGYKPPVTVWDVATQTIVTNLQGHEYGIRCVAFSPIGDQIISIGNIYDGFVYVWSWKTNEKLSCNRFSEEVTQLAFSPKNFFVTCGNHHIKFWYPERVQYEKRSQRRRCKQQHVLYGRPAILGNKKTAIFIDVTCGTGVSGSLVFTVTSDGHIVQLCAKTRTALKKKSLPHTRFSSIAVHDDTLIAGYLYGHVYFLNALSLDLKTRVPLPADICYTGGLLQLKGEDMESELRQREGDLKTYVKYDHIHRNLIALSSDGKMSVWDVSDLQNPIKRYFFYCHCGGIQSADILPNGSGKKDRSEVLVTVSEDATMRLWTIDMSRKVSCNDTTILYTGLTFTYDTANSMDKLIAASSHSDLINSEIITVVKVCGESIVTGDSKGQVSAYQIKDLEFVKTNKCHSKDVTCLEYFSSKLSDTQFIFSGGRDRQIAIYSSREDFSVLNTLQLHSGSMVDMKVFEMDGQLVLVSAGNDRTLLFLSFDGLNIHKFTVLFNRVLQASVADCCVVNGRTLCIGLLNGDITKLSVQNFVVLCTFPSSNEDNARVEKLVYQSKDNLIVAACSNRTINLICYDSGTILTTTTGHATAVTGLRLSASEQCVISTTSDGCIFVWSISSKVIKMRSRMTNVPPMKTSSLDGERCDRSATPSVVPFLRLYNRKSPLTSPQRSPDQIDTVKPLASRITSQSPPRRLHDRDTSQKYTSPDRAMQCSPRRTKEKDRPRYPFTDKTPTTASPVQKPA